MRWSDGDTEVQLIETESQLQVSTISERGETRIAAYGRGEIRSVVDMHSTRTCTLRVLTDGGTEEHFRCPPEACVVLLRKLRVFQGANAEAALPEARLLAGDAIGA